MVTDFYKDLNNARKAEALVALIFSMCTNKYKFDNVGDIREYFYKGDIKATAADGREIFIEVKDDSRIADTHNVLCEYGNYYKESRTYGKGNMQAEYDIYCINSKSERRIYVIDFAILKANYKLGRSKIIYHDEQDTYCTLLPLE